MSQEPRKTATPSRREMLGTMARWTVPTVLTMTLGARVLEAKASCPPCQKKAGVVCRSCTVSQMLNCSCEPCLGPPYCSAVGPVAPMRSEGQTRAPGSQPILREGPGTTQGGLTPYQQMMRDRARAARDPFRNRPMYDDPFGARKNELRNPTGLYDRLRPDTLRRQP
jgi:hypothetical protein